MTATAVAAALLVSGSVAKADDLSLSTGKLSYTASHTRQVVSVKNDTNSDYRRVFVECGFFKSGELVASSPGILNNLAAGSTGFTTVNGIDVKADRAECRVSDAK